MFDEILNFLDANTQVVVIVFAIAALLFEIINIRREQRKFIVELTRVHQDNLRLQLETLKEKREEDTLGIEERRLSEVNVDLDSQLLLTDPSEEYSQETPFVICNISLENIGDGPVDVLAALASSRIMNSKYKYGIGLRSRDVAWNDFETHFWNHTNPEGLFTGTSTTRDMVTSEDDFIRLAAHEKGAVRRIDAVNNVALLKQRTPVYMVYRVFLVARGYPLGEVLRQLGAAPPKLLESTDEQQLQFRSLAQPNYGRWRGVQLALLNLSHIAFKVASNDKDPLEYMAEPDGWRFFLLHHQEFTMPMNTPSGRLTVDAIAEMFWEKFYPDRILPPNFGADPIYEQAREFCTTYLKDMLMSWNTLRQTIASCQNYDPDHPYLHDDLIERIRPEDDGKQPPNEGYPMRIHCDNFYRKRWLNLMREGYLISRPFAHQTIGGKPVYTVEDIPDDPRLLEPFVMRTHYVFNTLDLDKSKNWN